MGVGCLRCGTGICVQRTLIKIEHVITRLVIRLMAIFGPIDSMSRGQGPANVNESKTGTSYE